MNAAADDKIFIKLLKKLDDTENLTQDQANLFITQAYPKKPFLGASDKNPKVLFRKLVQWKITNLLVSNLETILKLLDEIYPVLYSNRVTLDNYFSADIRVHISKRFGYRSPEHKLSLELTALPYAEKGELMKSARDKVINKNLNRVEIKASRILKIISDNIVSEDVYRRCVALAVASGSRPIELFHLATYTIYDPHYVTQTGVAKKKGASATETLIKPIIEINSSRFIEEIQKIRDEISENYSILDSHGKLNSNITKKCNDTAKLIFDNQQGFTFYTSRKLYAALSYELFAKKSNPHGNNVDNVIWFKKILGHSDNTNARDNYSIFDLVYDLEDATSDEILAKVEVIMHRQENLEQRFDAEEIANVEPPILSSDIIENPELQKKYNTIKEVFDKYKADNGKKPTQNEMERLAKEIAPRSIIRNAIKYFLKNKTV